jgi:hypothetical protein
MYKAAVRYWIRRNIRLLNEGRYGPALKMFAVDGTLSFPGENSWAAQYRVPVRNRDAFVTHQNREEIEGFLQRYVATGMQMIVDDVLVNGPPWNLRAAARVHHWAPGPDGEDIYTNRAILMVRTVWGKIREQEDYEDTERVAAFDKLLTGQAASTSA